jgi:Ca2+-binding RTX toxin-like protein
MRTLSRIAFFGLLILIVASISSAVAASNTVPRSHLTDQKFAITANSLKPPECAALNLTAIVVCPAGGGNCQSGQESTLILGSPNINNIHGKNGDDCILGGPAANTINGGNGNNVCISGPGSTFFKCTVQIIR